MNRVLKYIFAGICGGIIIACMVCSFIAGSSMREEISCTGLEICIKDSLTNSFVSQDAVKKYLDKEYGIYVGKSIKDIDLVRIEKILDSRSAVLKSQAYITGNGVLHIDVTQRSPIVRFQKKDGGFYADAEGYIFPLQNSYASHVQIVDGYIPLAANSGYKGEIKDAGEREWFRKVINLVNYMQGSRVWKDKIVQIHVDSEGNLILIPREGNEQFIIGQPDEIEEKFEKMRKYYTAIIPEKNSGTYRHVDLRYRGQIVCR